jgi:CBS domain-containing protein
MNVAEVMNWDVIAVTPGVSIQEAARLMISHGVSGLPATATLSFATGPGAPRPGGTVCSEVTIHPPTSSLPRAISRSERS